MVATEWFQLQRRKTFNWKNITLWPPSDFNCKEQDLSITKIYKLVATCGGVSSYGIVFFTIKVIFFISFFKCKFHDGNYLVTIRWFFSSLCLKYFFFFVFCNQNHLVANKQFYQKNEIEYTWQPQFMVCLHCVYVSYMLHRDPLIFSNVLFAA